MSSTPNAAGKPAPATLPKAAVPPTGAPAGQKKGSVILPLALSFIIAVPLSAGLQMEIDDKFREYMEKNAAEGVELLQPIRNFYRSIGLIDMLRPPAPKKEMHVKEQPYVVQTPSPEAVEEESLPPSVITIDADVDATTGSEIVTEVFEDAGITDVAEDNATAAVETPSADSTVLAAAPAAPSLVEDIAAVTVADTPAPTPAAAPVSTAADILIDASPVVSTSAITEEERQRTESSEMRKDMEMHFLADLDKLDEVALRKRIISLVAEFTEKSRWEAVKLHQSLKHVEKEVADHYSALMAKQSAELRLGLERELSMRESEVRNEMTKIINDLREAQEFRIQDALRVQESRLKHDFEKEKADITQHLKEEADLDMKTEIAKVLQQQLNRTVELQNSISEARAEISAFHSIASAIVERKRASARAHEESAAVLALEAALSSSQPVQQQADRLKSIGSTDSVLVSFVDALPPMARLQGVPTLAELRSRFVVAKEEARKAALAPQSTSKIVGQIIGSALAYISWEAQGNVQGDSPEAILARVSFLLDQGKLASAVKEVERLSGYPRSIVSDWETAARNRVVVDQITVGLKAAAALDHLYLK